MKKEVDVNELDQVTGGSVVVSDTGRVGFSTLGQKFWLQNCTWRQARNYAEQLLDENPQMSDREFDEFVKAKFEAKGWI